MSTSDTVDHFLPKSGHHAGKKNSPGKADEAIEGFDGWLECCAILNDLKQHISFLHPPGQCNLESEPSGGQPFSFEHFSDQATMEDNAEQGPAKTANSISTQCNLRWTLTCAPFLANELLRFANTSNDRKAETSGSGLRAVVTGGLRGASRENQV